MVYKTILLLVIFLLAPYQIEAASSEEAKMRKKGDKNHLANASSPYLQAHADNPVDWYEWGEEAFAKAKTEDKPIFLSIGYNACHWCHVMEHESFENEEIAALLNEHFVSIKVDREERPDIDEIYMSATQAMTGGGGWPMSVFMTPDKKPFFAGTYFPPDSRYGRPGFKDVVMQLAEGYKTQKTEILQSADAIVEHIARASSVDIPGRAIDSGVIVSAAQAVYSSFDSRHGGFGAAPKFPQGSNLSMMFRAGQLSGDQRYAEAALFTLRKMANGGIYDQFGGGFHRYSTDAEWLIPHFEKMLYDNCLLTIPYLEAYQLTGDEYYLDIVHGILNYLQSEMTDKEGGFYSTQDADSEGEEGKYYVWTKKEVYEVIGPEADWFCEYFDITQKGNFEHKNIPNLGIHSEPVPKRINLRPDEFEAKIREIKSQLLAERKKRIPPSTDDKILASWNGLAISAFAQAAQVTGDESYLTSAQKAADFVISKMIENGTLYHSYRNGNLLRTELLEDYAYFTAGLIDLYQASFDEKYLKSASSLAKRAVEVFSTNDAYFSSPADDPDLIFRPRDLTDGATPSPASVMIHNLFRLAAITGDQYFAERGEAALAAVSGLAARIPQASAALLIAGYFHMAEPVEIVIVGNNSEKMKEYNREVFSRYIPNKVIVGNTNGRKSDLPLLEGRQDSDELTYYFCLNRSCRLPVTEMLGLRRELDWVTANDK
jgi:uncharacterized protein YyaL (SSP411 family)